MVEPHFNAEEMRAWSCRYEIYVTNTVPWGMFQTTKHENSRTDPNHNKAGAGDQAHRVS